MARISEIINIIEEMFPKSNCLNMGGFEDNVGLLVGSGSGETSTVLCCLDVTSEVVDEAIKLKASLIISHHPFIFTSVKSVTDGTTTGKNTIKLLQSGISVYSAHTNMDFSILGINRFAADLIGLKDQRVLDPYINQNEGLGIVGNLNKPLPAAEFLRIVSQKFDDKKASLYGNDKNKTITKAAIINGGGGSDTQYIDMAIKAGANCLITGDIKHHVGLYAAQNDFCLIEVQHYKAEKIFIPALCEILNQSAKQKSLNFTAVESKSEYNPRIL